MVNRTYRYFEGVPLFPFGYGLYVYALFAIDLTCFLPCSSYTTFKYSDLKVMPTTIKAGQNVTISVIVTNTGRRPSDEVR